MPKIFFGILLATLLMAYGFLRLYSRTGIFQNEMTRNFFSSRLVTDDSS